MSSEQVTPQWYRKQPVVVEAMCFTTNSEAASPTMDRIVNWINQGRAEVGAWHNGTDIFIYTPEGQMRVFVGDWVIRGVKGEFYPCKPDIFEAMYEAVEPDMGLGEAMLEGARVGAETPAVDGARMEQGS